FPRSPALPRRETRSAARARCAAGRCPAPDGTRTAAAARRSAAHAPAAAEERCRRPLERIRQALRRRYCGHRDLMIEARFAHLERGGHVEDLLAVLDGDDATVREAVAVEAAIHLIDDGGVAIAAPQEIRVQRVHHARFDGG